MHADIALGFTLEQSLFSPSIKVEACEVPLSTHIEVSPNCVLSTTIAPSKPSILIFLEFSRH